MRPSANSQIARKPGFLFALVNSSAVFFALVRYFSGTPVNLILLSTIGSLVLMNGLLIFMRLRREKGSPQAGAGAAESKKV
jgi:hypothetical protein